MKIQPSKKTDLLKFKQFWESAVAYQQTGNLPVWPAYPESLISQEIEAGHHFSAHSQDGDGALAGYFSIALSDGLIWGDKETGNAIYIHRMCVAPHRKGANFTPSVLAWAYQHAALLGRTFVRMDTWADNKRLIEYYVSCGFCYIGDRQLGLVPDLPAHYNNTKLALFENLVPQALGASPHQRIAAQLRRYLPKAIV